MTTDLPFLSVEDTTTQGLPPDTEYDWRTVAEIPDLRPHVTERWLRRLIRERRIVVSKVGGRVFVDLADLDRYMERNIVASRAFTEGRSRRGGDRAGPAQCCPT